ncbi:MAG TPA: hypothetical protein VLZ29_04845 [Sulfurimonas sp.]|jgi:hypothetical protein|uniref:hypothetical protein n=1 Tax=Sulfurimonas sp. TaxID=2022749 RepID=UPI002CBE1E25|nr:hypothetical protein [Sulfurimonas sp.]HUH42420.1 hypothetical protein [Sulfurimonas sp.]
MQTTQTQAQTQQTLQTANSKPTTTIKCASKLQSLEVNTITINTQEQTKLRGATIAAVDSQGNDNRHTPSFKPKQ